MKLPNGVTPYFSSLVGVRQSCNLGPMLFNLFVNDIFYLFDNAKCDPVKLQTKLIHCLMYADDLLILSETENGLTESLERLSNYAKKWKLKISAKKTKIITHLAGQTYVWQGCKWNFAGPQIYLLLRYLQPAKIKSPHFGVLLKFLVCN